MRDGSDASAKFAKRGKAKVFAQYAETAKLLDDNRFFNESFAEMDIDHWSKIAYWTADDAVALSLGKDPRVVTWESIEEYGASSGFVLVFAERRELIRRAIETGQLAEKNAPAFFLGWALRTRFYMSGTLVEAVSGLGNQIADWKTEYDRLIEFINDQSQRSESTQAQLEQEKTAALDALFSINSDYMELIQKHEALEQEAIGLRTEIDGSNAKAIASAKDLSARERDSMLKLVIGMAIDGYGYDPKAVRSPIAKELASNLALVGLPLDDDTVRKYLNEAKQLLPGDETE